ADRARNFRHGENHRGYMARAGPGTNSGTYFLLQFIGESLAFGQYHEQHDAYVALPLLADDNGLADFVQGFHLAIDFSGTDANTARVEHRIGATVNDQPIMAFVGHGFGV